MPIYEYQCSKCGEKFEALHPMSYDGSKLSCPKCNTKNPKRLLSSFFSPGSVTSGTSETSCQTCSTGTCGLP